MAKASNREILEVKVVGGTTSGRTSRKPKERASAKTRRVARRRVKARRQEGQGS